MRETYLDLPSRLEDAFPEIDNDIMIELRNEMKNTQPLHSICIWCVSGMIWSDSRFTSAVIPMRWRISKKSKRFDSTHNLDDAKAICDS